MGEWITAQLGDSFCTLASMRGFGDCKPLRNHAANAAIKNKALEPGEEVYIPDLVERVDSAPTEKKHIFVRALTFAEIRFVHGSRDKPFPDDSTLTSLEISNYRTDRAGTGGGDAFAGPDVWKFHDPSDKDPDAFKVEVTDNRTGDAKLDVVLEALHPIYVGGVVTGHDLNWSSAAETAKRRLEIKVHKATPLPDQRFRSAYLRLVVDEKDQTERKKQTLLVTDDQPNEEQVEILDQKVRATYIIKTCPIGGAAQCRVVAEAPIGSNRRRIKLSVGILRRNAGDATGFNGITEANLHHRVFRWFRRVYAQANMAPKLVGLGIKLIDPPDRNMVTVSDISGAPAHGVTSGGASPSRMSFKITSDRGVTKNVSIDIPRAPNPAARLKPSDVAALLIAQISDADFDATPFDNPASIGFSKTRNSTDVLVKDKAGGKVTISDVINTDRGANLRLATLNLNRYPDESNADYEYGSRHARQLLRNYNTGTDRMNCYVVGKYNDADTRGRSYTPCIKMTPEFQPKPEIANSCVMGSTSNSGRVMDGGNNLPFTFPHEAGHALLDVGHTTVRSELMASGGTSTSNSVRATKRLCDLPVQRRFANYRLNTTSFTAQDLLAAASHLGTISGSIFEPW